MRCSKLNTLPYAKVTRHGPPPPRVTVHVHECVGNEGHMGVCCCDCAEYWEDPQHGLG